MTAGCFQLEQGGAVALCVFVEYAYCGMQRGSLKMTNADRVDKEYWCNEDTDRGGLVPVVF